MIDAFGVGTPLWSHGFGCVTWILDGRVGVVFLAGGEPKVDGVVPAETAAFWAKNWLGVQQEDGRIESVDTGGGFVV